MTHHKHGLIWGRGLLRKKSSLILALSLACVIALASCGGGRKLQKSLTAGPPPQASEEGLQRGWQFVPEKFSSEKSIAVVYFHRPMSAFSCQAFNVNKNKAQGKVRVIKKAKKRKEGWRTVSLKGASSWDPTLVVCDESKTPPYAKGSAIGGKVAKLGKGRTPPFPSTLEREQGWKLVDTGVSKDYETRTRSVPNPRYDPKKLGSLPYITESYRVHTGFTVTAVVYLYRPSSVSCTAQQEFRGATLKTDRDTVGSSDEMGWFQLRFSFDADESGSYGFPVRCE